MEVCHEALELSPGERAGYVASVCGDDVPLRQEVEAPLAHAHTADGFLAAPAAADAAHVLGDGSEASMVGRQVASYTIGACLGVGGMGEVHRARDTKLGRDGIPALVLELVEGPTLAGRLAKGRSRTVKPSRLRSRSPTRCPRRLKGRH
jgi:hypothetical protein